MHAFVLHRRVMFRAIVHQTVIVHGINIVTAATANKWFVLTLILCNIIPVFWNVIVKLMMIVLMMSSVTAATAKLCHARWIILY